MKQHVIAYLPWLLSAVTVWMTLLAGNLHRSAWVVGLVNQALWLIWIVVSGTWGLIPLNVALWVVYGRNHLKWSKSATDHALFADSPVAPREQTTDSRL